MKLISIIIPVYNGAKTIKETLESIENQTWRNFEVIVVDDGSTDSTQKTLEDFSASKKLENNYLFIKQENKGAPAARNRGLKDAKGNFLFFCDADAVLRPDALEKMLEALKENTEASYVYSAFYWGKKLFKLWPFDSERLKKMPYIHTMSLIRRESFPGSGWDESIKKLQDWDLWLTMLGEGHQAFFINEVLFFVKPGGSISSWLPAFAYKAFPWMRSVKKYKEAVKVIKEKHGL